MKTFVLKITDKDKFLDFYKKYLSNMPEALNPEYNSPHGFVVTGMSNSDEMSTLDAIEEALLNSHFTTLDEIREIMNSRG